MAWFETSDLMKEFKGKMTMCPDMMGHFTANIEGNPVCAYIERRKAEDEEYYVIHHFDLNDQYLWNEAELYDFLNKSTWAWTFHPGKAA